MQILLAFIAGAAIGISIHFLLQGRDSRGVVLAPVIGAAASGIVWSALTWSGVGIDNPWIWLSALVAPAVVTAPVVALLARARVAADRRERERLGIA
ncbi:hypothetical protein FBY40_2445 [Microbacterium sp. SLBN-154]|uniref:hypothetical protein n=1 Tax=unclassified Microbacterium TaxID=2609290 RepID=UPI00115447A7|nr:hypothetical protein [Microbacterium sp. SLBN-154]TQK19926.1 hypothetical protein FBY40_2445 [Microbacterium sp. SLBN-154]